MKKFGAYISDELFNQVDEIAKRENRSFNQVLQLLLAQALRERERNRVKSKKKSD